MIGRKRYHSIRERLLYSFFLTAALMCVMVLYSFVSLNSIAISMTGAYRSNVALKDFRSALAMVESSLERYILTHTFESIDSYFFWRARLDGLAVDFNMSISENEVLLQEYTLRRVMETFLEYADAAVYARRANNLSVFTSRYATALRVYDYLVSTIEELNRLYFDRNIAGYYRLISDLKIVEILSILILVSVIAVNFVMVYILIYKITGPLVELSNAANELAGGNFEVKLTEPHSKDEVAAIFRAFKRMTVSIKDHVEIIRTKAEVENNLRHKELQMRELYKDAQLKTLQAQINPHFLFNTLNAGAQLAMMEGADNTCAFIEKTADFFRYNIQKIDKDSTLAEEISLIDNYMYIMKVRFADRLDYYKDIRCTELGIAMPSMILQPLVENALKHGIAGMHSGGRITLTVERSGMDVCVRISDNGSGMNPEKRNQLLHGDYFYQDDGESNPSSGNPSVGIGMINVITRLRMFYSDPDIFDIVANESGMGTSFIIRIRDVPDFAG